MYGVFSFSDSLRNPKQFYKAVSKRRTASKIAKQSRKQNRRK